MPVPDIFQQEPSLIQFCRHKNGIHEFTFLQATQAAVDHYFAMMSAWIQQRDAQGVNAGDMVRMIIDFRSSGTPNMKYVYESAADLRHRYPHILRPKTRCATLMRASFLVDMAQAFNNLLTSGSKDQLRIFIGDSAHDQAVTWLLREESRT
jgi:hypothetical protein